MQDKGNEKQKRMQEDPRNRPPKMNLHIVKLAFAFLATIAFLDLGSPLTLMKSANAATQMSPSPIGLDITRNTTHYSFTWTDTVTVSGAIIDWYCLQIQNPDTTYSQPCIYNSTYPASPVSIANSDLLAIYGYLPGDFITARLNQKRQGTAQVTYLPSGYNEEITGQDIIVAPITAVTGLAVSSSTRLAISVSWNAFSTSISDTGNSPITAYYVERSCTTCANGWYQLSTNSLATSITVTLSSIESTGMLYNTAYTVRVTPINMCGIGSMQSILVITTKPAPSAPTIAYAPIKNTLTATLIQVSWPAIANNEDLIGGYAITSYQLLKAISPAKTIADYSVLIDSNVLTFSQTTGWLWNTSYDYAVRAKNQLGLGPVSTTVLTLKTGIDPALCTLPTGMTIPQLLDVSPLSITIKWSDLSDTKLNGGDIPIFYQIEYSPNNSTWTVLNTGADLVFTYLHTVTTVFPSMSTQYYRVRAKNNVGIGSPSPSLAVTADSPPTGMTTITNGTINPMDITITWPDLTDPALTGGDPIIFYLVQWYNDASAAWQDLNAGGANALSYTHTVTTAFPSASYVKYRVKPKNGVGYGSTYSNIITLQCDELPLAAVTATIKDTQPKSLTIQWNELLLDSQNGRDIPSFYLVETALSTSPTNWTALNDGGAFATDYTYTLPNSAIFDETKQYLFRIRAKNGVGYSPLYSSVLSVQPDKKPQGMTPPYLKSTTLISNEGETMAWAPLVDPILNGGDVPFFYSIEHSADNINFNTITIDPVKTTYFETFHSPGTILTSRAYYRVRAENLVGMANVYSSSVMVKTTTNPAQSTSTANYTINVCLVNPKDITLCWSESTDMWGSTSKPNFFQVEWLNPFPLGYTNCSQVSSQYLNDWSNPTSNPSSKWQVISPITGNKFTTFKHNTPTGIFVNDVFPSGTYQCYRVRYHLAGVPNAQPTPYRKVRADSLPSFMHAPTLVQVNPFNCTVQWNPLNETNFNGYDDPIFYLLEWYNYDINSWQSLTTLAVDGLVLNYTHVRTGSFFAISISLRYRVTAQNGVGMGLPSAELVINPDTAPTGMDPINVGSIQPYSIEITWNELSADLNGGDDPIFYQLSYYNTFASPNDWVILTPDPSIGKQLSFIHTSAIMFPSASIQKYRVLPKNQVGWGTEYSTVLEVLCDTSPSAMGLPIQVSVMPKQIIVSWNPLLTDGVNGRDPIIYYQLDWDQGSNTWVELTEFDVDGLVTSFSLVPANSQTFPPNINVNFRVRAKNNIDFGAYSPSLAVLTDGPPTRMNTPTATSITPKVVSLKWNAITSLADTGRDPIGYYQLQYLVRPCYTDTTLSCLLDSIDTWREVTTEAQQGTSLTFVNTFTDVLKPDEMYYYRVCPKNGLGIGVCSDLFGMLSDTNPKYMFSPTTTDANITPYWIYLTWSTIVLDIHTGRDPAVFYDLQCDFGTNGNTWTSQILDTSGLLLAFNFTSTTILPGGQTFNFRLRAKNGVGWGVYSTITPVVLDSTPPTMNTPTVATANINPLNMLVTWAAISNYITQGGGDPIIFYGLEWDQGIGTWEAVNTQAQGLVTQQLVSFSTPFSSGAPVKFRTYAMNTIGKGVYSSVYTANADKTPQFMNTPVTTSIDPLEIVVSWTPITLASQTGGDAIIQYELSWDQGKNDWIVLTSSNIGIITVFTHKSGNQPFPSGSTQQFRVRAKNGVGYGVYSTALAVIADEVPTFMNQPQVDQATGVGPSWIYLTWAAITSQADTGRDNAIYYELQWLNYKTNIWTVLTDETVNRLSLNFNFTSTDVFPNKSTQVFRLRAKNGVGIGAYSTEYRVTTDSVPTFAPVPVTTGVTPKSVGLSWSAVTEFADNGGDGVSSYQLEFESSIITESDEIENWIVVNDPATQGNNLEYTYISTKVFPSGAILKFRLACINGIGVGAYSNILEVTADSVPVFMTAPSVNYLGNNINPSWIYLTWSELTVVEQTGRDPVIYYQLEWFNTFTDQFEAQTYFEEENPISLSYNFTLPQGQIFPSGSTQTFRMRAQNGVGLGLPSEVYEVKADTVPQFMNIPIVFVNLNHVNPNWIFVQWTPLDPNAWSKTGGDDIDFYQLEWDQGSGGVHWVTLILPSLGKVTSFNVTSENIFPSGSTQLFRVSAENGVGLGLYSDVLQVQADKVPQYMNTPMVDIAANQINPTWIQVTWEPLLSSDWEETGGDDIIYYELQWDQSQGGENWKTLTQYTPDQLVNVAFKHQVDTPYESGSLQQYRVRGMNRVGLGIFSEPLQVQADKVPQFMNLPVVDYNANHINPNWIYITWDALVDTKWDQTGGDPAIYYELQWVLGADNNEWTILTEFKQNQHLNVNFNHTFTDRLPSGQAVKYRLRARNGVGIGLFSEVLQIESDKVPQFMNAPTVDYEANNINPDWILLEWKGLVETEWSNTGGDYPVEYILEWNDQMNVESSYESPNWIVISNTPVIDNQMEFSFKHQIENGPFPSGSLQQYRLKARNGVGYGLYSIVTDIFADRVPQYMNQPEVNYQANNINPTWILLTWKALDNSDWDKTGGDVPVYYELEWDQGSDGEDWTVLTQKDINGLDLQYKHSVEVPFPSGSNQKYRLRAYNGVGIGLYSSILDVQADKVPQFMNIPQVDYNANKINPHWIEITWEPLIESEWDKTGGDPAVYYGLEWDQGDEEWSNITTEDLGKVLVFTHKSLDKPFENGGIIRYRLYAKNGVGFGLYSDILTIKADSVPLFMNIPEVNYLANDINPNWIRVTWKPLISTEWDKTGGDPAVYYGLEWDQEDDQWQNLTTEDLGKVLEFTHKSLDKPFENGGVIRYRLYAKNGVGFGAYSEILTIKADSVPLFMNMPQVDYNSNDINPHWIRITWEPLISTQWDKTGGDMAIYYGLEWAQDNNEWQNLTSESDGQKLIFIHNSGEQPFDNGCIIRYRLYAKNGVGFGAYSDILTINADSVPLFMNIPQVDYLANDINPNWIKITWKPLIITEWEKTGGDMAIFYGLEWDQADGQWQNLTTEDDGEILQFNHTSLDKPFDNGCMIRYRLYAKNGVGFGAYSDILTIKADSVPLFMNIPQVDYDGNDINPHWIQITWEALDSSVWDNTGGDKAVYYGLEWDQASGDWQNLTTESIGKVLKFNHTSLDKPFDNGCIIQYRLYAKNGVGFGAYSEILSIKADSVPLYMNVPEVDYEGNDINPHWIQITWEALDSSVWDKTGGDEAVYYGLEWDQASGDWQNLTTESLGQLLKFNHTSLDKPFDNGCKIQYRLYAKNGVGFGAYSEILTIKADSVPLYMNIPQVDYYANHINPNWIKVTWDPLDSSVWDKTGGDPAVYYGLEWDQAKDTWVNITSEDLGMILTFTHNSLDKPFDSGCTIKFRSYAKNGVGFGAYSDVLTITADKIPQRMNEPIMVNVDYNAISIKWNEIQDWSDTGGDDIQYYKVEFFDMVCYLSDTVPCTGENVKGTWKELTTFASQLKGLQYSHTLHKDRHFSRDRLFDYRICAQNGVGMGACSPVTKILTDTIPQKMSPLVFVEVYHDQTIIKWNKVFDFDPTGRSPVINYTIQWDEYQYYDPKFYPNNTALVNWKFAGNVPHVEKSPPNITYEQFTSTDITFVHEKLPNFIARRKIMYRIQAINNVGESVFSEPLQVITVDRKWSKPRSWAKNKLPIAGESFTVPAGQNWTFDIPLSPVYGTVKVDGLLQMDENAASLQFRMNNLIVQHGELVVGTRDQRAQGIVRITLSGGKNAPGYEFNSQTPGGNKLLANFGKLSMYGQARNHSSVLLTSVDPGQQVILVEKNLQWNKGDKLGFPPTNMRFRQYDYAVIESYNPLTGVLKLEKPLSYYHYGAVNSTSIDYSGVEMRGQVLLLSRNVMIEGENLDDQGCQILTSSMQVGTNLLRGQTFMDHVEIYNCSQYGSPFKAAFRFEDNAGLPSSITNVAMHHGLGLAFQIDSCQNVNLVNNTVWDFTKYAVNVSNSQNINIIGNSISVIQDRFLNEGASSQVQPAGIVGCINSDCNNLRVLNNVISSVSYAGYITAGHECGESASQQIFKENVAHSINGWGAVFFASQKSLTQRTLCVEGSYFTAYKCTQGGAIIYNATLGAYFSNMVLIDNHIGGTIMIGMERNENDTQIAIFRDSVFYGETEARDCSAKDKCSQSEAQADECYDRQGLMTSYFSKSGKDPLVTSARDLPLQGILSDASYGGESVYRNLTFKNFQSYYTWCSAKQQAIGLNPSGPDYHPRSKFFDTKFINVHDDSMVEMFAPPLEWINFRKCGVDTCTGALNTFLTFEGTVFMGEVKPQYTKANFQVAPYNKGNAGKMPGCHTFVKRWNAYYCETPNMGILLFESRDDDKLKRLITPITISQTELTIANELNSFMSHQETIVTQLERLSRWPAHIITGNNRKYDVKYSGVPPQRQRFTLVADIGNITIRIKYPKAGAYILRDRQSKQFTANAFDDVKKVQTPIKGVNCGENRYESETNTLEFFMTPNCSIWIEGVEVIQTNIRLNWTLKAFSQNGGTNKFKENLADSLGIKQSFIQIQSVREGSVIVDFQIVQAEEDPTFLKKGGLSALKTTLNKKIETQGLWLGAPILNATVTGKSLTTQVLVKNSAPNNAFDEEYKWGAKGNEVWIIPPPKAQPPAQIIVVGGTNNVTEVQYLSGSSLFAIIFGVLIAVGIILCIAGLFLYRRYKRRKEEQDLVNAANEVDQHHSYNQKKKINSVDAVNQSVESPLKGFRDKTIYDDDEAHDEQYHPMSHRLYIYGDANDFSTNRKNAQENDHLMTQQVDERRTRDQFFDKKEEEQAQATFGVTPMSDRSLSRNIDSDDDEMTNPVIGSIQQEETDPAGYPQEEENFNQESPEKMLHTHERDYHLDGDRSPPHMDFSKFDQHQDDQGDASQHLNDSFLVGDIDQDQDDEEEENIVTKQDASAHEVFNPHAFKLQRIRENLTLKEKVDNHYEEEKEEEEDSKPVQFYSEEDEGPPQKKTPMVEPQPVQVKDFDEEDDDDFGELQIEEDVKSNQEQPIEQTKTIQFHMKAQDDVEQDMDQKQQSEEDDFSFKMESEPDEEHAHNAAFASLEVEVKGGDNPIKDFMNQFGQSNQ